jgi:hypothetical protein
VCAGAYIGLSPARTRALGGKYEKAEAMHRQTLAWREKVFGHKHPDTLAS